MNYFRITGDMVHLSALVFLVISIFTRGSCKGVSMKSQIMLLVIYMARYADIFTNYISEYNTIFKAVFIINSLITLFMMCYFFKGSYDYENDSFWFLTLFCPPVFLAILYNYNIGSILEVLWAFSIYLEVFAMIPQFYMIYKYKKMNRHVTFYLGLLITYRFLYVLNWIYRNYETNYFDGISFISGTTQTILNFLLYSFFILKGYTKCCKNSSYPRDAIKNNIHIISTATLTSQGDKNAYTINSPDVKFDANQDGIKKDNISNVEISSNIHRAVEYENESRIEYLTNLLYNNQNQILDRSEMLHEMESQSHNDASKSNFNTSVKNYLPKIFTDKSQNAVEGSAHLI